MEETRNEYRDILYQMIEGFVILEAIFKENQEPSDYRFLEYNPEFEKLTGWYNVRDKLRSELPTSFDKKWVEI